MPETLNLVTLQVAVLAERRAAFVRLRSGYPIALAGAIWWAALGVAGYIIKNHNLWILLAFYTSGTIFPLALLLARIARIDFMRDRTAVSDAVYPALVSMVLFWPIAFSAFRNAPQLVPLVLAVGMSMGWPVIGWTYGQTALLTCHAVTRAVVCFILWNWFPATRFTILPLAVSVIYLITVAAILFASRPVKPSSRTRSIPHLPSS